MLCKRFLQSILGSQYQSESRVGSGQLLDSGLEYHKGCMCSYRYILDNPTNWCCKVHIFQYRGNISLRYILCIFHQDCISHKKGRLGYSQHTPFQQDRVCQYCIQSNVRNLHTEYSCRSFHYIACTFQELQNLLRQHISYKIRHCCILCSWGGIQSMPRMRNCLPKGGSQHHNFYRYQQISSCCNALSHLHKVDTAHLCSSHRCPYMFRRWSCQHRFDNFSQRNHRIRNFH